MLLLIGLISLQLSQAELWPRVKVQEGWLQGAKLQLAGTRVTYYSFKGIPYAKPPTGKLRFKAPEPPESWSGIKNATEHGSICIQYNVYEKKNLPGSEDCLFLNVYTRSLDQNAKLPVMFYIHGGLYMSGSGNDDMFGPDLLLLHNVVLVTINYRLEVLGFLQLNIPEVPGNAAMKDQVLALKWVQKNIRNFGGDPNIVTVFGQSAGGASAVLHMMSPMSKGLFKRAIMMSGVPFCDFSSTFELTRKAFILGAQLGFQTYDPYKLLDFLQNVPAEKLLNVNTSAILSEDLMNFNGKMTHFAPTIEIDFGNAFITEDPLRALKAGHIRDMDILIGHTNQEYLWFLAQTEHEILERYKDHSDMFVPTKILHRATPQKILQAADKIKYKYLNNKPINSQVVPELLKYFVDSSFSYDIYRFLDYLPRNRQCKTFAYIFSCQSDRNIFGNVGTAKLGVKGAAHMDDLAYIFNPKKYNLSTNPQNKGYDIAIRVSRVFANFAKYGNPTTDIRGNIWKEYDSLNRNYLDIGARIILGSLETALVDFWKKIFEEADVEF